jgi:hypothetical protein
MPALGFVIEVSYLFSRGFLGQVLLAVDGCVGTSPFCCWLVVLVHCHLLFSLAVFIPTPGFSAGFWLMVNYMFVSFVVAFG